MGCVGARNDLSAVEKAITDAERCLNFQANTSEYVDLVLRKYSINGYLNQSQIQEAFALLSMDSSINFFSLFKEEEEWSLKWLTILGILLSMDESKIKANLLFQIYDGQNNKEIRIQDVEDLLECIWKISVSYLPLLAGEEDGIRMGEVTEYVSSLESSKDRIIEHILARFSSPLVSAQFFVESFSQDECQSFLNPVGVRTYAKKFPYFN